MTNFVQYHNPDKNEALRRPNGRFAICTRKSIAGVNRGDRVWLFTSSGVPRDYKLIEWFDVDGVNTHDSGEKIVFGHRGVHLDDPVSLTAQPWIDEFVQHMGRFGRGFSRLTRRRYLRALEKIARETEKALARSRSATAERADVLEKELTDALLGMYTRAGKATGYWGHYYLRELRAKGGLATARRMLATGQSGAESKGFQALVAAKRTDLTVEAVVLEQRFAPLFTVAELAEARRRQRTAPPG